MFAESVQLVINQKGNSVVRFLASLIIVAMLGAVGYLMLLGRETEMPVADRSSPEQSLQDQKTSAIEQIDERKLTPQQLMSLKPVAEETVAASTEDGPPLQQNDQVQVLSGVVNQQPAVTVSNVVVQQTAHIEPTISNQTQTDAPAANIATPAIAESAENPPVDNHRNSRPAAKVKKLPALDNSDREIRDVISSLDSTLLLADWLIDEELVRKFVVMVDNMANGEIPSKHSVIRPLTTSFRAVEQGDQIFLDGYNFGRYAPYIDLLVTIDSRKISQLYQRYYPLMQQAYGELGYPRKSFHKRLIMAIDHLLDSPIKRESIELVRPSVMFKYADPGLEELSDVHKQMLRMGPENSRKLINQITVLRSSLVRLQHG